MTAPAINPFANLVRALSVDEILGGLLKISQPKGSYRVAIDPVLLAASAELRNGMRVLDVGCGVGTVGLCVLARAKKDGIAVSLTGIEKQKLLVGLARDNAESNGMTAEFLHADIGEDVANLGPQSFDCIVTNPPYLPAASADPSPDPVKADSNIESTADLQRWIAFCRGLLSPSGSVYMIHRADRMAEITRHLMDQKLQAIAILPLLPKTGRMAKRIIVRASFASLPKTELLPGLVLHNGDGSYTDAAQRVLQHADRLPLNPEPE